MVERISPLRCFSINRFLCNQIILSIKLVVIINVQCPHRPNFNYVHLQVAQSSGINFWKLSPIDFYCCVHVAVNYEWFAWSLQIWLKGLQNVIIRQNLNLDSCRYAFNVGEMMFLPTPKWIRHFRINCLCLLVSKQCRRQKARKWVSGYGNETQFYNLKIFV